MDIALKSVIRDVPDFPKKGIIFKDITPLLKEGKLFRDSIDAITGKFSNCKIDAVVSVESRGFIFGSAIAYKLGAGIIPVRKKGKLPYKTMKATYDLEYGQDTLEIHEDAIKPGSNILIVDDLLATGGTVEAVTELVKNQKGKIVGIGFLIELSFLNGRKKLEGYNVQTVITY